MTRNYILRIAIPIAIAIAVAVVWKFSNRIVVTNNRREKVEESRKADVEKEELITGVISEEGKKLFEQAQYLTVEKVIRTTVEDAAGKSSTNYGTYLVSDIDIKNKMDETADYSTALVEDGFRDEKIKGITFEEGFGLTYSNKNGWELYEELLVKNGMDGSLDDVSFDTETYKMTKQKIYLLNEHCSILDSMLEGEDYDKVMESKVYYQMTENEEGVRIPDSFTAIMKYQTGNQIITKSIFLQVAINNWNTGKEG